VLQTVGRAESHACGYILCHDVLKILHISTRLILGGSQENTVLSCEGQARLGHEVHLAFGPIYGPEGSLLKRVEAFRTDDGRGITTHVVPSLVRSINPWHDVRCWYQLRALIQKIDPDIIHTHSSKAGIIGRSAGWSVSSWTDDLWSTGLTDFAGVVHTIHGPPFMPIDGGGIARLKTRVSNRIYEMAERYAAKRCHLIVSVANAMTEQFLARGIGQREQYVTVYSGMEVEPYLVPSAGEGRDEMRSSLGFAANDFVVGTVARLAEHKGHDDVLSALAGDLKATPTMKLLWVGDGWWRARLIDRAGSLGLKVAQLDRGESVDRVRGASVVLTGLVPPERVPGLVRAMDVLAHPSLREGLPRTVPQALLSGVCPVAYDCDGTGEACIDMQIGRLVKTGDVQGLREALRWCAENPQLRGQLAERGRAMCAERFSAQTMVRDLEAVYQRALRLARQRS
jgi:glycosyltransferase involved in cell wall biosynthesis